MDNYIRAEELKAGIGFQAAVMATLVAAEGGEMARERDGEVEDGGEEEEDKFLAMLESVIREMTHLIDAWICTRVRVSEMRENSILRRICMNLSRYEMFARFARDMIPEAVARDKDEAMKLLEKIQKGEIEIVAVEEAEEEENIRPWWSGKMRELDRML